jgi:hypothetical protein
MERGTVMSHRQWFRRTRVVTIVALAFSLGLLGACRRSEEAPKPAPQAPAPKAPAPQAPAGDAAAPAPVVFKVVRIDLGKAVDADKRVGQPTSTFKPNDTIYASVLSEGVSPSVALAARWTYEDGQLVNESTQTIATTGPAATEFHIAKPDGWPAGNYKFELAANGQTAGSLQFSVVE